MIRKPFILFALMLLLWLTACAPSSQPGAPKPTVTFAYAAADQSLSTPNLGAATVLGPQGAKGIFLRSQPNAQSAIAGEVKPGDSGRVLGVDSSGTWMLVQIKNQTGWLPVQLLDYTIAH